MLAWITSVPIAAWVIFGLLGALIAGAWFVDFVATFRGEFWHDLGQVTLTLLSALAGAVIGLAAIAFIYIVFGAIALVIYLAVNRNTPSNYFEVDGEGDFLEGNEVLGSMGRLWNNVRGARLYYNSSNADHRRASLTVRRSAGQEAEWLGPTSHEHLSRIVWEDQNNGTVNVRTNWGAGNISLRAEVTNASGTVLGYSNFVPITSASIAPRPTIRPRSAWTSASHNRAPRTRNPQRIVFHHAAGHSVTCAIAYVRPGSLGSTTVYNYLILPNGVIYEILPVRYQAWGSGNGTDFANDVTVSLFGNFQPHGLHNNPNFNCCVVPGFTGDILNQAQMNAMESLVRYYALRYNMQVNNPAQTTPRPRAFSPIAMHYDLDPQDCPGINIRPWIEDDLRPRINAWVAQLS